MPQVELAERTNRLIRAQIAVRERAGAGAAAGGICAAPCAAPAERSAPGTAVRR